MEYNSPVEEKVVHYYNVILGKIPCGAKAEADGKNYSVFPECVNCASCLSIVGYHLNGGVIKPEERSAA